MKNIYYWCPFIGNIATIKAVINSADSLVRYSNKKFTPTILNSCGEWDNYKYSILKKNINVKKFKNIFNINIKTSGYLRSRLTYVKIFLSCFFLLKNTLKKDQPEFLIAHLITSLPIFLYLFFRFKTKLIIRVSGKVKMNFLRKLLWKFSKKNITLITCPTLETQKFLINLKLIDESKIIYLPDPVIEDIKFKDKILSKKKLYFLSVGRLTKQKNHDLLIDLYKKYKIKTKLLIVGDGELKNHLLNKIKKNNLQRLIQLKPFTKKIYTYYKNAKAVLISSLWEDPGFVMIESAYLKKPIISSDCPSGPREFLKKNNAGFLFKNNNLVSLYNTLKKFEVFKKKKINFMTNNAYKASKNYTLLSHYKIIRNYLM